MQSIIDYIKEKYKDSDKIQDELWNKGKTFTIYNKDGEAFSMQEYGSYVDEPYEYKGGKLIENEIYDKFDYRFDKFDGWRGKQYFLLDSKYFDDLIKEKTSQNCYATAVDDLLKEGYVPQRIPVLLFETAIHYVGVSGKEKLACNLLNHYGVQTAYNDVAYEIGENCQVTCVMFQKWKILLMHIKKFLKSIIEELLRFILKLA